MAFGAVMDGKVIWHLMEWPGYEVTATLFVDSAAAKGMLLRDGVGAVKHLDVRSLWIQQERHDGLKVKKVAGDTTPADLCTKDHPQRRFEVLRDLRRMVDCAKIDGHQEHQAMAIEYAIGGGERRTTSRPRWRSGALRLLLAAATLAESEGNDFTIYKESNKCECNYE